MKKLLIFSLLLTFIGLNVVKSQTSGTDSLKKQAVKDAKKFTMKGSQVRLVKKGIITDKSDLFKPTTESTKKTNFLLDSTYVKTYRAETYNRAMKGRTSAHHLILGVEIAAGLLLAVTMIALGVAGK
jgi:hypothetical protein